MSNLFGASGSFQSQTGAKTSGFSATTSTSTTTTNNNNINSNSNGNNSGNSRKLVESNQRRRGATAGTDEQRIETSAKAEVGREIAVSGGGGGGGGGGGSGGGTSASIVSTRVGARESATSARQARAGSQFVAEASGGARSSASGDIVESRAGQRVASSSASSSSSSPTPASTSALTSASVKRQQQYTSSGSGSSTTSNTQRLSSIEILNENKQRQLQLEQQESFKQHLEKRQKFIQQQQQSRQSDFNSTYQVETSAPEYARMAAAAAAAATSAANSTMTKSLQQQQQQLNGSSGQKSISTTATLATLGSGRARNPFDEESRELQSMTSQQRRQQQQQGAISKDGADSGTVSGRSGFLAALMGDSDEAMDGGDSGAKGSAVKQQVVDESCDELDNGQGHRGSDIVDELVGGGGGETRYSKVAQSGACSYNYDEDPHRQPFYKRDLATLLQDCRGSRKLVILIVAVALLLDNMLLTAVVPIIPAYLYKLRVEREHREAIGAPMNMNRTGAAAGKSAAGRFGSLDTNQDGRVDEDELAAELERRINQSLANVQDRFSGSVFNPRVLSRKPAPLKKQGRWNKGDDSGGDDDDDDDDDDSDDDDGVRGRDQGRKRKGRFTRAKSATQLAAATSPSGASKSSSGSMNIDDNDDYEANDADDDDGDDGGEDKDSKNGKVDREKQQASNKEASGGGGGGAGGVGGQQRKFAKVANGVRVRIRSGARSGGRGDSGDDGDDDGANEDDDDDDDEDVAATKKWNKLRSSLMTMAKMSGNDTDALGGMCLSMVLGRPTYFDQSQLGGDASVKSSTKGQRGKSDRMAARVRGQSKNDDDDDDDDDDDREDEPAEKSSMRGGRNKSAGRRNSEKWVAPGSEVTSRKLSQPARVDRIRPPASLRPAGGRNEVKQPEEHDGDTGKTTIGDDEVVINHQDIVDESFEVGVMFASKPIVQAIANPFVGAITNRVGFTLPMFLGFTIMFLSTLVFAFGSTYATLFAARAIQGVGSACTSVAGMSMIADRFPDDAERGNAMAVALGGLALGVVIGPPFGGFMYEFFGKPSPFIVLACLALLDGLLQLLVLQPRVTKCTEEGASLLTLIKDPYILVAAGAITFANTGIGILEPALPLWMMDTMQAKNWEQGVAFLPAALSYLFSTNLFGNLGLRIGRWRSAMLGLIVIGCALLLIPFATRVDHLILPNGAIGFAIGMVDSTMMPMLGYLVDIRHTSVYGSVYAIGDVAFCASFVFGPALSGTLVELIGFEGLIITTALICFGFAPLLIMLKDPPARQVNEAQLQEQSTLRYVNYNHLDSPDEEAQLTADPKYKHYQHISTPATSKTTVR